MKQRDDGTLVPHRDHGTLELAADLGTMVINEPAEMHTMKRHDTDPMDTNRPKYRPLFLEHFDKKELNHLNIGGTNGTLTRQIASPTDDGESEQVTPTADGDTSMDFQRAFVDEGNFEFLKCLSASELEARMARLDAEMELEIEELRTRYQLKRQPIVDAIDVKRKRQQNF